MTIEQIKEMVNGSSYDFLRTNEHLGDRIIFLTIGGSHAYGTDVETSDVDIRGCAMSGVTDLLGLTNFEQVVETNTDTTVYAFNKLISLLMSCNPNTIEMLGCKPEHYIVQTELGLEMVEKQKAIPFAEGGSLIRRLCEPAAPQAGKRPCKRPVDADEERRAYPPLDGKRSPRF